MGSYEPVLDSYEPVFEFNRTNQLAHTIVCAPGLVRLKFIEVNRPNQEAVKH